VKFKFAFEKLLAHKQTLEEIAQKNLAEAQRKLEDAKNELNALYQAVDDVRARSFELERQGGQSQMTGIATDEFIKGQKYRIEKQKNVVREKMWDVEQRQDELIIAAREKKTLEKLREKKLEEFQLEMKRKEVKEVDDIVTMRFKKGNILTG
jgi:flagellar protein FliJ